MRWTGAYGRRKVRTLKVARFAACAARVPQKPSLTADNVTHRRDDLQALNEVLQ